MADEFTPTTGEVRALYAVGVMKVSGPQFGGAAPAEFERMISRVKHDAARGALDGLAENMRRISAGADNPLLRIQAAFAADIAAEYKTTAYPETEDQT